MRMLILILMQMLMLLLVLMLMPRLIADKCTCTIRSTKNGLVQYTLLNTKMNIHSLSPSLGRCCSLLYDCLFLHLCLAVAKN